MKSTEYYAFEFRHRINLEEYLKANYNLRFKKSSNTLICTTDPDLSISTDGEHENTWLRNNIKQGAANKHGVFLRAGNVIGVAVNFILVRAVGSHTPSFVQTSAGLIITMQRS